MGRMIARVIRAVCLASVLCTTGARADIARPDNSCPTVGKACGNAGPDGDEKGTCQAKACSANSSATCQICEVDSPKKDDESGCSVRAMGAEKGIVALLLGVGVAAVAMSRRRR